MSVGLTGLLQFAGAAFGEHAALQDEADDGLQPYPVVQVGKDEGAVAAHFLGVPLHDFQGGVDVFGDVDFVDDQQVGFGDAGAAFPGDFVAGGDVDDVQGKVGEFGAECGGEVVAAGFDEDEFQVRVAGLEVVDGGEVHGGVFADGGVGAAAGFHAKYAVGG